MCDPATLAMLAISAVSAGSSLFGGKGDTVVNTPPPAEAPAIAAPTSRKSGAAVRMGRDDTKKANTAASNGGIFTEKRKAVTALGGLGRSGLTL